jgi:hypothetical protein
MKTIQLFDPNHGINAVINMDGEMSNLTDLWKAAGSDPQKTPAKWQETDMASGFIQAICKLQKVVLNDIIKSKRGKGGGTWAIKEVAIEYAQYLNPNLAVLVNQIFFERIEEEKNPDKIVDRAVSTYKKKGKDADWISRRIEGKLKRNEFTSTLASHGVQHEGFRNCTNAIYEHLFGGGAAVVREKKKLPETANVRDGLSGIELDAVKFAESLASHAIKQNNIHGNAKCEVASRESSRLVANTVKASSKIGL